MSKIGKNIKKIRTVKKLSQASFAQLFNLARPSVGAYEEGRAEPKIDTVIQIANHFNLSIDALLIKDLTINDLYRFDSLKKKSTTPPSEATRKNLLSNKNLNTRLVEFDRYLEYLHNYRNDDFIDNLPSYHIPLVKSVSARAFEIGNQSMAFDNAGLLTNDIVICERKIETSEELHTGHLYVLVLDDNILIRRLFEIKKKLKFTADNPDWQQVILDFKNINELWEVCCIQTRNLLPPVQVNKRINILEEKVDLLSKKMESFKKSIDKK